MINCEMIYRNTTGNAQTREEFDFIRTVDGMIDDILYDRGHEEEYDPMRGSRRRGDGDGIIVYRTSPNNGKDSHTVYLYRGMVPHISDIHAYDNGFVQVYNHTDCLDRDTLMSREPDVWVRLLEEASGRRW